MIFFLSDMLRTLANVTDAQQGAFDLAIHHERLVSRRDLRPAALEQGKTQLLLQFLDDPGDRWLGAAQHFPGSGDTACRHHCCKRFELTQIHIHALIITDTLGDLAVQDSPAQSAKVYTLSEHLSLGTLPQAESRSVIE